MIQLHIKCPSNILYHSVNHMVCVTPTNLPPLRHCLDISFNKMFVTSQSWFCLKYGRNIERNATRKYYNSTKWTPFRVIFLKISLLPINYSDIAAVLLKVSQLSLILNCYFSQSKFQNASSHAMFLNPLSLALYKSDICSPSWWSDTGVRNQTRSTLKVLSSWISAKPHHAILKGGHVKTRFSVFFLVRK